MLHNRKPTFGSKVDCDVVEKAARARNHRGGKLVAVNHPLAFQREEEERGGKVEKRVFQLKTT